MSDPPQPKQPQSRFTIRTKSNTSADVQYYVPQTNVSRSGRAAAEAAETEAFNARVNAFCDQQPVKDFASKSFDDALAEVTRRQNARIQRYNEQKKRGPPMEPMPYTGPVSAPLKFKPESDLLPSERKEWRADALARTPINSVFTELRLASLFSVPYKAAGQPTLLRLPDDDDHSRDNMNTIPYTYLDMREKQNWDFANKRLAEGIEYLQQKNVQSALDRFKMAVDMQPKCAEAYFRASEIFFEMKNMKDAFETADRALKADPSHKAARSLWHAIKDALRPPSKSKSRESRSESSHSGRKRQSSSSRRDEHLIHQDRQASSRSKDDRERGRSSRSRGAASPAQDIHRSNVPSMPRSDTARVHTKSSEVPHSRSSTSRVDHAPHHDYHAREVRTSQEARSSGRHQRRSAPDQVSEPITSEGLRKDERVDVSETYSSRPANIDQEAREHARSRDSIRKSRGEDRNSEEDGEIKEKSSERHRERNSGRGDSRRRDDHHEHRDRHHDSHPERDMPKKSASVETRKRSEHATRDSREQRREKHETIKKETAKEVEATHSRDDHAGRERHRRRDEDHERTRRDLTKDHHRTEEAAHRKDETSYRQRDTRDYDAPRKDNGMRESRPRDGRTSRESRDRPREKRDHDTFVKDLSEDADIRKEEARRRDDRSPRDRGNHRHSRRQETAQKEHNAEKAIQKHDEHLPRESNDKHRAQDRHNVPEDNIPEKEQEAKEKMPNKAIDPSRDSKENRHEVQERHDTATKHKDPSAAKEKGPRKHDDMSLQPHYKHSIPHDDYETTTKNIPRENEQAPRDAARQKEENLSTESKDKQHDVQTHRGSASKGMSKEEEDTTERKKDDKQGLTTSTKVTQERQAGACEQHTSPQSDAKLPSEGDSGIHSPSASGKGELRIRGIASSSSLKSAGENTAATDKNVTEVPARERSPRLLGSAGKAGFMTSLKRANSALHVTNPSHRSAQTNVERNKDGDKEDPPEKRRRITSNDSDLTEAQGKSSKLSSHMQLYDPRDARKRWQDRKQTEEVEPKASEPRPEPHNEPNRRDKGQRKGRSEEPNQGRRFEFLDDDPREKARHRDKRRRR